MTTTAEAIPAANETHEARLDPTHTVVRVLERLGNPEDPLAQAFYGAMGVQKSDIACVAAGSYGRQCLKDETSHVLELDGEIYEASSFKRRGALMAALLALEQVENPDSITEFVTASHGNHGIAVAMAALCLGKKATIYCPSSVNAVKRAKLEALGATVVIVGDDFEEAMAAAKEAGEHDEKMLIHPFDQAEVIAGQATVGLEMMQDLFAAAQRGEIDLHETPINISVAVAGGGFISGVALVLEYYRQQGLIGKNVRLYGAQMENCDAARRSVEDLRNGGDGVAHFADGEFDESCDSTAVKEVGNITLPIMANPDLVQGIEMVSKAEVWVAMQELSRQYGHPVEPAGALAYALNKRFAGMHHDANAIYIAPVCGANVTQDTEHHFQRAAFLAFAHRVALLDLDREESPLAGAPAYQVPC